LQFLLPEDNNTKHVANSYTARLRFKSRFPGNSEQQRQVVIIK